MELTLDQVLQKGIEAHREGRVQDADRYYTAVLKAYPSHPDANHNIGVLAVGVGKVEEALPFLKKALEINPSIAQYWLSYINGLIKLDRIEEAKEVLQQAKSNGAKGDGFDQIEENLKKKSILEANDQDLTKILDDLRSLISAERFEDVLAKGLDILPRFKNSESLHNIIGIAYQGLNQDDKAEKSFRTSISLQPDFFKPCNNLGALLKKQGKLEEAMEAYTGALLRAPENADANENYWALKTQLKQNILVPGCEQDHLDIGSSALIDRPRYQIFRAIYAYLSKDQKLLRKHLENYKTCTPSSIEKLKKKDQVFCFAYYNFLRKLVEVPLANELAFGEHETVFHLGESHCLSYAHNRILIHDIGHIVEPRITFGGKAYHFAIEKDNSYKAITKANFHSVPDASKVFLSFGEIDCRPNEGIISAASKLNRTIEELVSDTTRGYVDWFAEQNQNKKHRLFFLNVPAPIYDNEYSEQQNGKVRSTIDLFNNLLGKTASDYGFKIIDVYKFTVGGDGYSNGAFHVDGRHLSSDAIPEIEKQVAM